MQTLVVKDEKVTALPEAPPVAVTVYVAPATFATVGWVDVKVMLCPAPVIVNVPVAYVMV